MLIHKSCFFLVSKISSVISVNLIFIHFVFVHLMQVLDAFQKFDEKLQKAGEAIKERNATTERFPNRWGPTKVPYTLLYPKSDKPGLTGMGVPNSISI